MVKNNSNKTLKGGTLPTVNVAGQAPTKQSKVISNSMKFLDSVTDDDISNPRWIPESIQKYLNPFIRKNKALFDNLLTEKEKYEKHSDEHISIVKQTEKIAKSFINVKNQIDEWRKGVGKWKADAATMNKGTQDSTYFTGSAVYGIQHDEMHIDANGMLNFLTSPEEIPNDMVYGVAKENYKESGQWGMPVGGNVRLADVGEVIKEPFAQKTHVFKLAERTKSDSVSGKPFNANWTYNNALDNLTTGGPNATIGMAFSDLASDGQTKTFAEMYDGGMKKEYYVHPDTGEDLPEGVVWMKDPANADVLSKLLAKYVTNVMKDIHGPTINEETGLIKKSRSQLAQDIIKKYSKKKLK
ncbi:hypothetical protein N9987_00490 [bacterium]|nr:hypothetical protein [bacterium]